jgi:hypothetical protein
MPKKFDGENSKAAAAKARKDAAKNAEKQKKEEAEAEEYWRDDDRNVAKKKQRQEDKEKKRQEQLAKKAEIKAMADKEIESIKVEAKQTASKITRLQIQVYSMSIMLNNGNNNGSFSRLKWRKERQLPRVQLLRPNQLKKHQRKKKFQKM